MSIEELNSKIQTPDKHPTPPKKQLHHIDRLSLGVSNTPWISPKPRERGVHRLRGASRAKRWSRASCTEGASPPSRTSLGTAAVPPPQASVV